MVGSAVAEIVTTGVLAGDGVLWAGKGVGCEDSGYITSTLKVQPEINIRIVTRKPVCFSIYSLMAILFLSRFIH